MDRIALKEQLAAAVRMLERAAIVDFNGHASIRTGADSFLVNSGASVRNRMSIDDIVEIDGDGQLLDGAAAAPMEFPIHAEIYRRRTDVHAVIHAHPQWSTVLTSAGRRIEPVFAQGTLLGAIPLFEEVLSINSRAKGAALAETLGGARAVLLQSHGSVVVGADMVECFALAVYLEENAGRQYRALQVGAPRVFTAEEAEACRANLWKPNLFRKTWDYYAAKAGL